MLEEKGMEEDRIVSKIKWCEPGHPIWVVAPLEGILHEWSWGKEHAQSCIRIGNVYPEFDRAYGDGGRVSKSWRLHIETAAKGRRVVDQSTLGYPCARALQDFGCGAREARYIRALHTRVIARLGAVYRRVPDGPVQDVAGISAPRFLGVNLRAPRQLDAHKALRRAATPTSRLCVTGKNRSGAVEEQFQ
eukprot:784012-Pleurochrysis_carterae.AAC.2